MIRIDLNCDLGESSDPAMLSAHERIIRSVTSINIACGWHAGNPEVMRRMVQIANAQGARIGAHPGYRDPEWAGRCEHSLSASDIENLIAYQVSALAGIAALEGGRVSHVKPHGALYNTAAADRRVADAIARAVRAVDPRLILYGLAGSQLVEAARSKGLRAAEEVFADRAYRMNGTLVPRAQPGAVLSDEPSVLHQVMTLVCEGYVTSVEGHRVALAPDTLCLHGDTPGSAGYAESIRLALEQAGVRIAALDHE
jgi:5-oxoprolinase (ATP-hydrolysing) subunit A